MLVIATVLLQLTSFISSAQSNNQDEIRKLEDLRLFFF